MTKFIGRLVNLGLGRETSRGTGVAATFWLPKTSEKFFDNVAKARSKLNYGTIDGGGNIAPVALKWAEGDIEFNAFDASLGLFLYNLLGSCSSAVVDNGTYTHTFTLADSAQHNSLSVYVKDPDRTLLYENAMVDSLTLEVLPEEIVKATAKIVAKGKADATATPSYTNVGKVWVGRNLQLKIAATTADLTAASLIKPKRLRLTIKQNVMRDNVAGTIQPADILNQQVDIDGEIELNLNEDTYRDYILDGSYKAMRIKLVGETIGTGTNTSDFTLDLSRVDFDQWEPTRLNDEIAKQTFNFHALYDLTNGNVINSCTLRNVVASY